MTPDEFLALAAAIAALNGLTQDTAEEYLAHVGTALETDDDGLVIVRGEAGAVLARIKWPEDEGWGPEDEEDAEDAGEGRARPA